jgi:hypothetical protein
MRNILESLAYARAVFGRHLLAVYDKKRAGIARASDVIAY